MPLILSELRDDVGVITLAHDEKRNALSRALIDELTAALDDFRARKVRVAILRARPGARVWSAGHDVAELPKSGRDPLAYDDPLERGIRAVRTFPAPIIALLEGSVWGGACELALCCDLLVGTSQTTFALTPARLGVPYNPAGILRIMATVGHAVLKEMFFTAQPLPAARAYELGILNRLVPIDEVDAAAAALARDVLRLSPLAIAAIKEQVRLLANASPLAPETFERIQGVRRAVYDSRDYGEGIAAFLEKRTPTFRGE